jgi:hypothetical protein
VWANRNREHGIVENILLKSPLQKGRQEKNRSNRHCKEERKTTGGLGRGMGRMIERAIPCLPFLLAQIGLSSLPLPLNDHYPVTLPKHDHILTLIT